MSETNDSPVRLLLVEDNPGDARLIQEMLAEAGVSRFDLQCVDRLSSALERLAHGGIDVVLLGLSLPDSRGFDTVGKLLAQSSKIPIIVLTGLDDEALAAKAVREGVQDYLVKGQIDSNLLVRAMRYAIERKRGEEAVQQRNRELATLNAIAQSLSRSTTLNEVLNTALNSVLEAMSLSVGAIHLLDENIGELVVAVHRGISEQAAAVCSRVPLGKGDVGKAIRTGTIVWSANLAENCPIFAVNRAALESENIHCLASVPLKSKDRVLGVLSLGAHTPRESAEQDIQLLGTIGNQIAVAIENAQLLEKTRQLSIADELTGLYNRRHFYKVLDTEIYRAQRYGRPGSLVMLDLDGFKRYNDTLGHSTGDALLKAFAQKLESALRKADMAFRYGGDEFAIILPVTPAYNAKKIVDRLRSKWLQAPRAHPHIPDTNPGFSAGIAQFPEDAETADGLIFLADTALYHSKREGGCLSTLVSELSTLSMDILDAAMTDQVYALAATVDARDPYTYGHSKRVAAICEVIGKAIGLPREESATLHAACLLHDIGKVGVPDSVLTSPGKPTEDEWGLLKKHSAEGARIVGYVKKLAALVPMIRHHHEWYDGMGYPDGLRGKDIPLGARIMSVADAYDTMTTKRQYRNVVSPEEALEELRRCSDTQFDPELVEALCRVVKESMKPG